MPYESNDQLPSPVKESLPSIAERDRFRGAFNACMYDSNGDETKCFRIGYAAARKAKSRDLPVAKALVEARAKLPAWAWAVLNRDRFEVGGNSYTLKEVAKSYSAATVEHLAGRGHDLGPMREQFGQILDSVNDTEAASIALGAATLPGWVRATLATHFAPVSAPVVFVGKSIDGEALELVAQVYAKVLGCDYSVQESADGIDPTGAVVVALGNGEHVAKCDARLPHPKALLAKGDRGEVVRKSRAIKKMLDSLSESVEAFKEVSRIETGPTRPGESGPLSVTIKKDDPALQVVTGIVLEPYGGPEAEPDTQGDFVSAKEIETAAHSWLAKSRVIGLEHSEKADGASPVESYLVPYPTVKDYQDAMRGEPHKAFKMAMGDGEVVSGSWVVSTKLDDSLWDAYKSGELSAYSMGGMGARRDHKGTLPVIEFIGV